MRVITVLEKNPIGMYEIAMPLTTASEREFESTEDFFGWLKKRYDIFEFVESDEQAEPGLKDYDWCIYKYRTNYQQEHKEVNQAPFEVRLLVKEIE